MTKTKVLVVDDNREILDFFQRAFFFIDYQVTLAHNAEEALQVFGSEEPDIVLLDIKMPSVDGIETLRRIKKLAP